MDTAVYVDYKNRVKIDEDIILVAAWNKYIAEKGGDNKICFNNKEFFDNAFKNAYDAAWAVAISQWRWADRFVCFDADGCLITFTHWDDENSPIVLNKIDVSSLINLNKKRYVNNIPKAIHDALQEG